MLPDLIHNQRLGRLRPRSRQLLAAQDQGSETGFTQAPHPAQSIIPAGRLVLPDPVREQRKQSLTGHRCGQPADRITFPVAAQFRHHQQLLGSQRIALWQHRSLPLGQAVTAFPSLAQRQTVGPGQGQQFANGQRSWRLILLIPTQLPQQPLPVTLLPAWPLQQPAQARLDIGIATLWQRVPLRQDCRQGRRRARHAMLVPGEPQPGQAWRQRQRLHGSAERSQIAVQIQRTHFLQRLPRQLPRSLRRRIEPVQFSGIPATPGSQRQGQVRQVRMADFCW